MKSELRIPSHEDLIIFWLQRNTRGVGGTFNKNFFPKDYKLMVKELKKRLDINNEK